MSETHRKMETASNILGYVPWILAGIGLVATGQILVSLALLTFSGFVFFLPAIVIGHVARNKIRGSEGQFVSWGPAVSGLASSYGGLGVILVFFLWLPYADPFLATSANESSAVGSLRSIHNAAESYRLTHPSVGFPQKLADISSSTVDDAEFERIDPHVAMGEKSGYRFTYIPHKGRDGQIESYEVFADPTKKGVTGKRHFFFDQSGILRFATKMQADAQSGVVE